MGGCCSLVPGVAAALRLSGAGPVGLAYIDGHLDTYDPKTSPTGEAADMPVAICAGLGDRALVGLGPAVPLIDPAHIALLAHRDSEEARAEGSVMPDALGIGTSIDCATVAARAARGRPASASPRSWPRPTGRFWLSIDVDVLSGAAMPATPVQQDGGLSLDELAELARAARAPPGLRRARPALLRRRPGRRRAHERPAARRAARAACSHEEPARAAP